MYRAKHAEQQMQRRLVRDLLDCAFGGSTTQFVVQALASNRTTSVSGAASFALGITSKPLSDLEQTRPWVLVRLLRVPMRRLRCSISATATQAWRDAVAQHLSNALKRLKAVEAQRAIKRLARLRAARRMPIGRPRP